MGMSSLVSVLPRVNQVLFPKGFTKSSLSLSQLSLRRKPIPVTRVISRFPPRVQAQPCSPGLRVGWEAGAEWTKPLGTQCRWGGWRGGIAPVSVDFRERGREGGEGKKHLYAPRLGPGLNW